MASGPTKNILIVDDNLADIYLLQKTLRRLGVETVESVSTGEEAAKYVVGLAPFAHRRLPDAIFIDLKMAGVDGFQLIEWLSKNPLFQHIPLIVFSGSNDPQDRQKALELGAKAYYQKTAEAHKLLDIVQDVVNFIQPPTNP